MISVFSMCCHSYTYIIYNVSDDDHIIKIEGGTPGNFVTFFLRSSSCILFISRFPQKDYFYQTRRIHILKSSDIIVSLILLVFFYAGLHAFKQIQCVYNTRRCASSCSAYTSCTTDGIIKSLIATCLPVSLSHPIWSVLHIHDSLHVRRHTLMMTRRANLMNARLSSTPAIPLSYMLTCLKATTERNVSHRNSVATQLFLHINWRLFR